MEPQTCAAAQADADHDAGDAVAEYDWQRVPYGRDASVRSELAVPEASKDRRAEKDAGTKDEDHGPRGDPERYALAQP